MKTNLLNLLFSAPYQSIDILDRFRDFKMGAEAFENFCFFFQERNDPVEYFMAGEKINLWRQILDSEQYFTLLTLTLFRYFRHSLSRQKKTGFSPELVFSLVKETELYDFIKSFCFESPFEKEMVKGLKLFYTKASDSLKEVIFLSTTEHSPLNYFKPELYKGSWDARLSSGQPLFFKIIRNKIFSADDFLKVVRSLKRPLVFKDYLSFKDGEENIAEYLLGCFLDWPQEEFSPEEHLKVLKEILALGDVPAFRDSHFLKIIEEEQLENLTKEHFNLFKQRWLKEKKLFSKQEIPEVVRKFIRAFYSFEVSKEFYSELKEIEAEHGGNLLDALGMFPMEGENRSPERILREFKELGLGIKSQDLINDLIYPDTELDELNVKTFPLIYPALSRILALESGNFLYLSVPYLETLAKKAHPEHGFLPHNFSLFHYHRLENLIQRAKAYQAIFRASMPLYLRSNKNFIRLFTRNPSLDPRLLNILLSCQSEKELQRKVLGVSSSFAQKTLSKMFSSRKCSLSKMYWAHALVSSGFNYDRINYFLNSSTKLKIIRTNLSPFLKDLKNIMSEDKILKIVPSIRYSPRFPYSFRETHFHLQKVLSSHLKDLAHERIRRVKNFEELSGLLANFYNFSRQEDFPLLQDKIISLEGKKVLGLEIHVPKSNYELIELGNSLHICVGEGYYANQVRNKTSFIFILRNRERSVYCVEVDRRTLEIKQAKSFFNDEADALLKTQLVKIIGELHP